LAIGNAIVTRAGPDAVVAQVEWKRRAEGFVVYNFEVEDDHTYFVGNAGIWVHNPVPCDIPRVTPGSLSAEEEAAVVDALDNMAAGTQPAYGKKWGVPHMNKEGRLPGTPGAGGYEEYYVQPAPGVKGPGARRLVVGLNNEIYYTWDHYQTFFRVR